MVKNKKKLNKDLEFSKTLQNFYDQEYEDFLNNFENDVKLSFSILSTEIEKSKKNNYKYLINKQRELLNYYNNLEEYELKKKNNLKQDYLLALQLDRLINQSNYLSKKTIKNKNRLKTNISNKKILNCQYSTKINPKMKNYIDDISDGKYILGIMETGGGGDCLFSTISEGIKQAFINPHINQNQCFSVQELRKIVKDSIINWDSETFKNNLEIFKVLEDTGDWDDLWSPAEINNKIQLADQFFRKGNNHWGTDFDIDVISDRLNIGILIFRSEPNLAELYSLVHNSSKKKKYYMLIYNINMLHYKLAGLKKEGEPFISVFNIRDLPQFLKDEYYSKCKHKI